MSLSYFCDTTGTAPNSKSRTYQEVDDETVEFLRILDVQGMAAILKGNDLGMGHLTRHVGIVLGGIIIAVETVGDQTRR